MKARLLTGFVLFLHLPILAGQERVDRSTPWIRGQVLIGPTSIPVEAARISLVGEDGEVLVFAASDEGGEFTLRAPSPGTFFIRSTHEGYRSEEQGPFTLETADTLDLVIRLSPVQTAVDSALLKVQALGLQVRSGQQVLYGHLLDNETGDPIPQGEIRLVQQNGLLAATALSDEGGLFWMVSPAAGTYRMIASRIGYRTSESPAFQLMFGDTLGVDFYLSVDAVLLDPIVVTATARGLNARYPLVGMQGFARRYSQYSESGFGEFLTRDSIAKYEQKVATSGHLLMEKMISVREVEGSGGLWWGLVALRGCPLPTYFVDGLLIPPDAISKGQINPMTMYLPETLEAVEVYVSPNIPAEFFRGGSTCGVVALWTRREPVEKTKWVPAWRTWLLGLGIICVGFFVF